MSANTSSIYPGYYNQAFGSIGQVPIPNPGNPSGQANQPPPPPPPVAPTIAASPSNTTGSRLLDKLA